MKLCGKLTHCDHLDDKDACPRKHVEEPGVLEYQRLVQENRDLAAKLAVALNQLAMAEDHELCDVRFDENDPTTSPDPYPTESPLRGKTPDPEHPAHRLVIDIAVKRLFDPKHNRWDHELRAPIENSFRINKPGFIEITKSRFRVWEDR